MPKTSQDTKVLSGKRTCSVQSVDSGFIATQYSRDNSQDGIQNSQTMNLQQQPSPFHLTVSSLSPSPLLGVAGRPLAHPLQRVKQDSRMALWGTKHHHRPESGVLIDEDDDTDTDLEKENVSTKVKYKHIEPYAWLDLQLSWLISIRSVWPLILSVSALLII